MKDLWCKVGFWEFCLSRERVRGFEGLVGRGEEVGGLGVVWVGGVEELIVVVEDLVVFGEVGGEGSGRVLLGFLVGG